MLCKTLMAECAACTVVFSNEQYLMQYFNSSNEVQSSSYFCFDQKTRIFVC